jgi:hypothetical protein
MNIDRNSFLETFAVNTPALNLVCMNHLEAPAKLLTDTSAIELLADKTASENFIRYCQSHPLVKDIVVIPQYRKKNILIEFQDGSEMNFRLISNIVHKTLLCLDVAAIRKSAYINEYGLLVPSREHHFEYIILKCQFGKDPLSERFKNFFGNFDFSSRAVIFKYMQTRFNLIFNTLEDLYTPKPNMLLAIMIGLRAEPENLLIKMFLRSLEQIFFNLFGWITKKPVLIKASPLYAPELPSPKKKKSAGQTIL